MTQIPPAERFSRERSEHDVPRWFAHIPDADFDVMVPGDDEDPHPRSVALAAHILPDVGVLAEEAATYIASVVNTHQAGLQGAPIVISVLCDARYRRVTLELNWDSDLYSLWHVTFAPADDPARRRPIAFGRRDWTTPPEAEP